MNQSQILIAEIGDADGIQLVRRNTGGAWIKRTGRHTYVGAAEAFVLAERSGVDSQKLPQALSGGPASPVMLRIPGKIMADHEYKEKAGGIRLFLGLLSKIARKASEQDEFRLPNTANDRYREAAAGEYRDYDIVAMVEQISDRVEREKKA